MGKFKAAFNKAKEAKPISDFAKNIGPGSHLVAIKAFRGKESQKKKEVFVETEVMIMQSETEQIGATRGWAWFINAGGWTGDYAAARLQEFIEAIKESCGDDRDVETVGDELADEENNPGYGILLQVEVVEVPDKNDASKVMIGKNGRPVHNANWTAVEDQDDKVQLATQAKMKALMETAPAKKVSAEPAQKTTSDAPATQKVGGIKRLLGGAK